MDYSYVPFSSKPRSEIVSKTCNTSGKYRIKKKISIKLYHVKEKLCDNCITNQVNLISRNVEQVCLGYTYGIILQETCSSYINGVFF